MKKPKASKGSKGGKEKKWYDDVAEFSDATTDSDAVDLDAMTPEERERYLAERAKRREEREKRRREKYGDKYDEMFAANAAWVFCVFRCTFDIHLQTYITSLCILLFFRATPYCITPVCIHVISADFITLHFTAF